MGKSLRSKKMVLSLIKKLGLGSKEIIIIIGIVLVSLVFLIIALERVRKVYGVNRIPEFEKLCEKIVPLLEQGYSKKQILENLSSQDKKFIELHKLQWEPNLFPIVLQQGKLKNQYYPPFHVVVYSVLLQNDYKAKAYISYTARGEISNWRYENMDNKKTEVDLTRFGTNKILKGNISNLKDVPNIFNDYEYSIIYQYLLLKNLINNSENYLRYALIIAEKKYYWANEWLMDILSLSVVSPELPRLNPHFEEEFYDNLSNWYNENKGTIKFTNEFLFE